MKELIKKNLKYFLSSDNFIMDKTVFSLNIEEVQKNLSLFYDLIEKIDLEIIRIIKYFHFIIDFNHKYYYL